MSDATASDYLARQFELDPLQDAALMLQRRRWRLDEGAVLLAEVVDQQREPVDDRTRLRQQLNKLRRDFWTLPAEELTHQLHTIRQAGFAETATAAAHLARVVKQRDAVRQIQTDQRLHPSFAQALARIVTAPAAEANQLREREHRWMRPEQNASWHKAQLAIQRSVRLIRTHYPGVYALEDAWFGELLQYNPAEEKDNDAVDSLVGLLMMFEFGLTIYLIYFIITWIF